MLSSKKSQAKFWVIVGISAMTVGVLWASPPAPTDGTKVTVADLPPPPAPEMVQAAVDTVAAAVEQLAQAAPVAEPAAAVATEATAATEAPAAEAPAPAAEPAPEPAPEPLAEAPKLETADGIITHWPLQNAPIRLVLRQLAMLGQKNIVASKEVDGMITADLYNVTFREALDAVLRVNGFDYIEKGNFIYVYTGKQMEEIIKRERKLLVKVFTLHYAKPDDVKVLLTPCLSPDGSISITPAAKAGIGTSDSETGGMDFATDDVLVIRDYEENIAHAIDILKDVDKRPQQVLIEATIMSVTLKEENALGVNIQSLAGVDFGAVAASGAEGAINIDPTAPGAVSPAAGSINSTFPFSPAFAKGGLSVGFVSDNISFFIRALEGVSDTNVLANPKLLVVNKQRGEVLVGRRDGYLTQTATETTTIQNVEFLETGTRLVVRPYVGDNGFVRLEVHPEDSSGTVTNGLPKEETTECTSNVLVKDGRTIIISGLFRETTKIDRNQIPVLGNLPHIGTAFRSKLDNVERQEIIILLTPRIIKEAPDAVASEQLRDDVERFRIGMRQNLSCYGRGRLAAAHMRWAKENLANGNTCRALWDVNMALSLSTSLPEALELKERLTGEAIWAREPRDSSVRYIIQKMVMNDLGLNPRMVEYPNKPLDANDLPPEAREAMGIGNMPQGTLLEDFTPCPDGLVKAPLNPVDGVEDSSSATATEVVVEATSQPASAPAEAVEQ